MSYNVETAAGLRRLPPRLANQVASLLDHQAVVTTWPKAKELRNILCGIFAHKDEIAGATRAEDERRWLYKAVEGLPEGDLRVRVVRVEKGETTKAIVSVDFGQGGSVGTGGAMATMTRERAVEVDDSQMEAELTGIVQREMPGYHIVAAPAVPRGFTMPPARTAQSRAVKRTYQPADPEQRRFVSVDDDTFIVYVEPETKPVLRRTVPKSVTISRTRGKIINRQG